MSSYLDGIPQAVATIMTTFADRFSAVPDDSLERIAQFADQLTRSLAKALREADAEAKAEAGK